MGRYQILEDDQDEDQPISDNKPKSAGRYSILEDQHPEQTSSVGAYLRGFAQMPGEITYKLLHAAGANVIPPQQAFNKIYKEGDEEHPVAAYLGKNTLPLAGLANKFGVIPKALSAANRLRNLGDLKSTEGEVNQSAQDSAEQESQFEHMQNYLKQKYGNVGDNGLNRTLDKFRTQFQENGAQGNLEPTDLSNRLPGATGEHLIPEAQRGTQQVERQIQHYLDEGEQPHDVNYQNQMNHMIRYNRGQLSRGYDELGNTFENKNVTLPKTRDISEVHSELRRLISEGGLDSPEARSLAHELDAPEEAGTIPAKRVLTQYRTADKLAKQSYDKAYERNQSLTEEQRQAFRAQGDEYRTQADRLSGLLEEQVDPQFKETLAGLNSGWRQYASLYRNPLGRKIESGRGITGNNLLEQMRGNETGQQLLRNLTQSNPEALRSAIGHTYGNNPRGLLNASNYEQGFIGRNNHLPGMMDRLRQMQQGEDLAARQAAARQAERARVQRAYDEDVSTEAKKSTARKLLKSIEEIEQDIQKNRTLRENKENALKKNIELDAKYSQMKADRDKIIYIAKGLGKLAIIGAAGTTSAKILGLIFK